MLWERVSYCLSSRECGTKVVVNCMGNTGPQVYMYIDTMGLWSLGGNGSLLVHYIRLEIHQREWEQLN